MNISDHINSSSNIINRRSLLGQSGIALGSLAAASMLKGETSSLINKGLPGLPHFKAKAKRVIYMYTPKLQVGTIGLERYVGLRVTYNF